MNEDSALTLQDLQGNDQSRSDENFEQKYREAQQEMHELSETVNNLKNSERVNKSEISELKKEVNDLSNKLEIAEKMAETAQINFFTKDNEYQALEKSTQGIKDIIFTREIQSIINPNDLNDKSLAALITKLLDGLKSEEFDRDYVLELGRSISSKLTEVEKKSRADHQRANAFQGQISLLQNQIDSSKLSKEREMMEQIKNLENSLHIISQLMDMNAKNIGTMNGVINDSRSEIKGHLSAEIASSNQLNQDQLKKELEDLKNIIAETIDSKTSSINQDLISALRSSLGDEIKNETITDSVVFKIALTRLLKTDEKSKSPSSEVKKAGICNLVANCCNIM